MSTINKVLIAWRSIGAEKINILRILRLMVLWHRSSGVFTGCVKTDYGAAVDRKKRSTERLVYRKGHPSRGGWREVSPNPRLEGQSKGRSDSAKVADVP